MDVVLNCPYSWGLDRPCRPYFYHGAGFRAATCCAALAGAQVQIRRLPKPVVAMVAGYAVGGGHVLHMVCDLTIAADNAVFGQTGPKVGSFDASYGSTQMAAIIGAPAVFGALEGYI